MITLAGVPLTSPVLAASGCAGAGPELEPYSDLSAFGAVVCRSITAEPRAGAPLPRLVESVGGLVNALGLPGPGLETFLADELPRLRAAGATVIVSVWADDLGDYARIAQRLRQTDGIVGVEVNLSHPSLGTVDPAAVVHQVRRNSAAGVPVFAKLGIEDVVARARSCAGAGADGVSLINAIPAVSIHSDPPGPGLGTMPGGLSGPAIRPIALRAVWAVHAALPELPIIGSGGIMTGTDAFEFLLAGASAVALGTALLNDPRAGQRIAAELEELLAGRTIDDVRGQAHERTSS